ncbi:SEC-C metal-binding domain-containing protein [Candidatus Venteria ishoeyi]|uniref:Putative beta-lactamase HcpC n=1 Tax=Candidatus Venteria ishoeyi TaxID=1899563 RepID=A0A1H6F6Z5_9GAMM|nr:SEC-C metal-binding domain-containing protein [Candidatus Venteria ishoeyi]SEH05069.1 Putative beta-lactamase HcpC precursor [Candidatus Venteria ishoeyi]
MLSFIHSLSPTLHRHYELAYRHWHEDPENTLVKLRACAQVLVDLIFEHYQMQAAESEYDNPSLYDQINTLESAHLAPYHIRESLNFLRVEGNKGAHPGGNAFRSITITRKTALQALKTAYEITCWLYETLYAGQVHEIPDFTPPSESNSDKLYGDALMRNDADAQYAVGMIFRQRALYLQRLLNKKQYEQRRRALQKLAESNMALENAAEIEQLQQIQEDLLYWFRKAVAQQHPGAQFQLAQWHLNQEGDAAAMKQAKQLLEQAAAQGDNDALYTLGCFYLYGAMHKQHTHPQDYGQAFEAFMQAAQHDHLGALNQLVQMYYEGLGVAQDLDEAFYYAQKAALAGFPSAQFKLAHLYQAGLGVAENPQTAFHWYKEAAQGGYPDAQLVLFKYYSNGIEVKKDLYQAVQWLQRAVIQEHPGAYYYLGLAYKRGIGVKVDPVKALNLFKCCIEADTRNYYEGAKLEFAEGVEQLRKQAIKAAKAKSAPPFHRNALQSSVSNDNLQAKPGRNDPCPCGSGKKYKKCCM